jgi:clan AA aspartic protease (TIGR02281 family)
MNIMPRPLAQVFKQIAALLTCVCMGSTWNSISVSAQSSSGRGVTYFGQSSGSSQTRSSSVSSSSAYSGSSWAGAGSSSQALGPDQARVYFTHEGNSNAILVNAEINNRPLTMIFDTGASTCALGKNHLADLGIKPPSGKPAGFVYGVGSAGRVPVWASRVTIKVGQLVQQNCPVTVQEELNGYPLLGQPFFSGYTYSIDEGTKCITFKRKGINTSVASVPSSQHVVPFVREGRELVVSVKVNERSYPMYLDTGAEVLLFSQRDLQRLGITIPDYAPTGIIQGVAGSTVARRVFIDRLQLGPVDKSEVPIMVVAESSIGRPLLGRPFFEGWEVQIDNANSQILFTRR